MNIRKMDIRKRVLIGAVGVLALGGLGVGAASAATPPAGPSQSIPATTDTPTPGDTADTPGATEGPDTAGTAQTPGDTGPDVQQTGDHTDLGDAPGSP